MNINMLYSDLDPNFGKSWDNDVLMTKGSRAVKNSIIGIVSTPIGSRAFNPYFGCDLPDQLFENITPLVIDTVERNIKTAIRNFEPRVYNLTVDSIGNFDNNELIVTIRFSIVDNPALIDEIKMRLSN
ncbi:gp25 [Aeromonas phage 31]|uniref:Baseplate wedge subunit n=3 Tax=Biquartavirus 44RR2 TaxID=115987 RepID=Q6U9C4_9CAUD|nr:baseplate wedge subunit [Aeromonas phage 44RR2.8t]YP_238905.1 baseplate wedge subunit [Aeromonas phage 31]APU00650.1 baseplate wedge subunit [Aeromonas phage 44RR2.8t.2]APU01069.1 baseplate wedge subunit [Aeromonas phage 31.2]APU02231.1 baseplate wedge subunit [Aeromonas phage Riv-10]APU02478.1 baseplate wedge subunit [Aeromonas phage SW69-9]AAQ81496.1 baseplate wedge subunit [Aeromonas phage 44RR2.8t]